ncbi:hypothetical protein GCM10011574_04670 [Microbispora bryophytorum]|uniref:Uncharacterized protein n=1 Tax=Microbispora bryophytorum TaxID=1460882 RepID=A0A8H9GYS1_9ACTN|nr:hypothetical protein GCM10011574_04670 [Microbispora bryophytorum]
MVAAIRPYYPTELAMMKAVASQLSIGSAETATPSGSGSRLLQVSRSGFYRPINAEPGAAQVTADARAGRAGQAHPR